MKKNTQIPKIEAIIVLIFLIDKIGKQRIWLNSYNFLHMWKNVKKYSKDNFQIKQ